MKLITSLAVATLCFLGSIASADTIPGFTFIDQSELNAAFGPTSTPTEMERFVEENGGNVIYFHGIAIAYEPPMPGLDVYSLSVSSDGVTVLCFVRPEHYGRIAYLSTGDEFECRGQLLPSSLEVGDGSRTPLIILHPDLYRLQ